MDARTNLPLDGSLEAGPVDAGPDLQGGAGPFDNRLRRAARWVRPLPRFVRRFVLTWAFRFAVPFFGAARAHVEEVGELEVTVRVADRRQVRNHVRSVHAVAMALSAETATGLLVAMNLPDRVVPLLKKMNISYVHRSNGDLVARAHITEAQAAELRSSPKGEMTIAVEVVDDTGAQPIVCEMIWAWRHLGHRAPRRPSRRGLRRAPHPAPRANPDGLQR